MRQLRMSLTNNNSPNRLKQFGIAMKSGRNPNCTVGAVLTHMRIYGINRESNLSENLNFFPTFFVPKSHLKEKFQSFLPMFFPKVNCINWISKWFCLCSSTSTQPVTNDNRNGYVVELKTEPNELQITEISEPTENGLETQSELIENEDISDSNGYKTPENEEIPVQETFTLSEPTTTDSTPEPSVLRNDCDTTEKLISHTTSETCRKVYTSDWSETTASPSENYDSIPIEEINDGFAGDSLLDETGSITDSDNNTEIAPDDVPQIREIEDLEEDNQLDDNCSTSSDKSSIVE